MKEHTIFALHTASDSFTTVKLYSNTLILLANVDALRTTILQIYSTLIYDRNAFGANCLLQLNVSIVLKYRACGESSRIKIKFNYMSDSDSETDSFARNAIATL